MTAQRTLHILIPLLLIAFCLLVHFLPVGDWITKAVLVPVVFIPISLASIIVTIQFFRKLNGKLILVQSLFFLFGLLVFLHYLSTHHTIFNKLH